MQIVSIAVNATSTHESLRGPHARRGRDGASIVDDGARTRGMQEELHGGRRGLGEEDVKIMMVSNAR